MPFDLFRMIMALKNSIFAPTSFITFVSYIFVFIVLMSTAQASHSYVSLEFNCSSYNPKLPPPKCFCSTAFYKYEQEFEQCRQGNKTCFYFVNEKPFTMIHYDETKPVLDLMKPFPCGDYKNAFKPHAKLSGITFEIHERTTSKDDLCIWAGPNCEFNDIVDFIELKANDSYRLAFSGELLETPRRQCRHEASAATANDEMVIVGERPTTKSLVTPIIQLFQPFHWGSWLIFVITFFLLILVCLIISWHLQVYQSRSFGDAIQLLLGQQGSTNLEEDIRMTRGDVAARSFAARNGVVTSLFRLAIGAWTLIFVLFYEVAVVNFLFNEQTPILEKRVSKLRPKELENYGVLKNSALENVWASAVHEHGFKIKEDDESTFPWKRCSVANECVNKLRNGEIKFMVTFSMEAQLVLADSELCEKLTTYETKDTLFSFNAGWLYNSINNSTHRKEIDRQILALRINGEIDKIYSNGFGDPKCEHNVETAIAPFTILIPVIVLVVPPLLLSLFLLFFWGKVNKSGRTAMITTMEMSECVQSDIETDSSLGAGEGNSDKYNFA